MLSPEPLKKPCPVQGLVREEKYYTRACPVQRLFGASLHTNPALFSSIPMYLLSINHHRKNQNALEALLHAYISWGWEEEDLGESTLFTIYFDQEKTCRIFKGLVLENCPGADIQEKKVPLQDWNSAWKDFFKPIEVDERFIILPDWLKNTSQDRISIIITPKMAFGTGHHATTHLCLQAVSRLYARGLLPPDTRFLDLGTGSGILGIACAKLGMTGLGVDIDPTAVGNALENIAANRVGERFQVVEGEIASLDPDIKFDLILGNILSSTLQQLAREILMRLNPSGVLILSGIIDYQAPRLAKHYQELGLPKPVELKNQEWSALIWTGSCKKNQNP